MEVVTISNSMVIDKSRDVATSKQRERGLMNVVRKSAHMSAKGMNRDKRFAARSGPKVVRTMLGLTTRND